MNILSNPHKLTKADVRDGFCSGARELDEWLVRYALQNQRANNAITYVTTLDDEVVGYYAICAAGVSQSQVPSHFAKHRPQDIPCILLARLAVDKRVQGKGIGAALLRDAILRASRAADAIGATCLLVHCRDEQAKAYYLSKAPFLESPVRELQLLLPMKEIKKLTGGI